MIAPRYESHSTLYSTSISATATLVTPEGTQPGDLLLAILTFRRNTSVVFYDPAGWTRLCDAPAPSLARVAAFWRLAEVSEPATHTFQADTTSRRACGIIRFSGASQSQPINTFGYTTGTNPHLCPEVTTDTDNCMIVRGIGFGGNQSPSFGPDYNRLWSLSSQNDGAGSYVAVALEPVLQGLVPALSVTGGDGVAMTIAIGGSDLAAPSHRNRRLAAASMHFARTRGML